MPSLPLSLRRAPRTLMFWLVVAVLALGVLRAFFPVGGFDEVRTGEVPLEVGGSDDGVWVLNHADHTVSLVRPSDEEILFTADVGETVEPALSVNEEGAWVILDEGETVARVDPTDEAVADRIDLAGALDGRAQDLAAGDGFLWVTSGEGGQMVRVDTTSGEVDDAVDVGETVVQPQILDDALWVTETSGLGEYDVQTGERRRVVETAHRIHDFVATDDALWVLSDVDNFEETGLVVRLNPTDGTEDGRLRIVETRPSHLAVTEDQIFVSGSGGRLTELSIEPLELVATEQVAVSTKDLRGVTVLDGTVWVADGTNGVVHQPIDDIEGDSPTETTLG